MRKNSEQHNSRKAFTRLIRHGYVDGLMAGNALATHDLEASYLRTALGQDVYTQKLAPLGHYNHLDTINKIRLDGGIHQFIQKEKLEDGIMVSCDKGNIPFVLVGSIRDDGPLPEVVADAYEAQNLMRQQAKQATTVICLATQLHSIATGNMTPAYQVMEGAVRPVFIYSVDVSEFAVNKLKDRGSLEVTSIVTNIQDFLVHIQRKLV